MKSVLFLTTAFGIALGSSALADNQLRHMVDEKLEALGFEANVYSLSDGDIAELWGATSSTDNEAEAIEKVRAIMAENPDAVWRMKGGDIYVKENVEDIYTYVQAYVESQGMDVDVAALDRIQVAEAYIAIAGGNPDAKTLIMEIAK